MGTAGLIRKRATWMRTSRSGEAGARRRHPGSPGSTCTGVDRLAGYGLRRRRRSGGANHRCAHRAPSWNASTRPWSRRRGPSYGRADRRTGYSRGPGFRLKGSTRASRNGTARRRRFWNGFNRMPGSTRRFRLRGAGKRWRHTSNGSGGLSQCWRRFDYLGDRSRGYGGCGGRLGGYGRSGRCGRSNRRR